MSQKMFWQVVALIVIAGLVYSLATGKIFRAMGMCGKGKGMYWKGQMMDEGHHMGKKGGPMMMQQKGGPMEQKGMQ